MKTVKECRVKEKHRKTSIRDRNYKELQQHNLQKEAKEQQIWLNVDENCPT